MQLRSDKKYKHREISDFLDTVCPLCSERDHLSVWSSVAKSNIDSGIEVLQCERCYLTISFKFKLNQSGEVIDEFYLDSFKVGFVEFKNNKEQLALYFKNVYVNDVGSNLIDLDKCKQLVLLS